ncbi:scabin-related ADP-ribosyltransferase [Aliiroseovarius crassostreae]
MPDTVYRGDTRGPDEIFDEGFHPKDPNADVDLQTYVQSECCAQSGCL